VGDWHYTKVAGQDLRGVVIITVGDGLIRRRRVPSPGHGHLDLDLDVLTLDPGDLRVVVYTASAQAQPAAP
jgi:hypothetical protein